MTDEDLHGLLCELCGDAASLDRRNVTASYLSPPSVEASRTARDRMLYRFSHVIRELPDDLTVADIRRALDV